jgi:restriction endonuclease S subunit
VAQVDCENIALAQRVIKYRSKNKYLRNSFLKHYLLGNQFQVRLEKTATGSTVKGIKGSKLHKLKIPIPPLAEQERIVAILDKFDALVNGTTPALCATPPKEGNLSLRTTPPEEGNLPSPDGATPPKEGNITALTDSSPDEGNLCASLPAELNARRKQYEYYRNKLLTFKEFNSPPPEGCQSKTDGVVS